MLNQVHRRRRRRRPFIGPLFVVVASIAAILAVRSRDGADRVPGSSSDPLGTETVDGLVARIIDGDTVELESGVVVRYLSIDTPESGQPFFEDAVRANRERVLGKPIRLDIGSPPQDRYGRLLAHIFIDHEDGTTTHVNEAILRDGWGVYYEVGSRPSHRPSLIAAQCDAMKNRRGIWTAPLQGRRAEASYIGSTKRFHRPACRAVERIRSPIRFDSRLDPFEQGLSPCRLCSP